MTANTHYQAAAGSPPAAPATEENVAIVDQLAYLTEATLAVAYEARTANLLAFEAALRSASHGGSIPRLSESQISIRNEILERLDRPGIRRDGDLRD